MILITQTGVYINMPNITTMGKLKDNKTLVVNNQAIKFDTVEECNEIFDKISTFLTNTAQFGTMDLRDENSN